MMLSLASIFLSSTTWTCIFSPKTTVTCALLICIFYGRSSNCQVFLDLRKLQQLSWIFEILARLTKFEGKSRWEDEAGIHSSSSSSSGSTGFFSCLRKLCTQTGRFQRLTGQVCWSPSFQQLRSEVRVGLDPQFISSFWSMQYHSDIKSMKHSPIKLYDV